MIPKPSILIPESDSLLSRQMQELLKALSPLLDGAVVADKQWNQLSLVGPWTNWGPIVASKRTLLNGMVATQGLISTTGGQSNSKAVSNGAIQSNNYITLPSKILKFPVNPTEAFILPPQHIFFYTEAKEPFYSVAALSMQKDGSLQLDRLLGRAETRFAVEWLTLDWNRYY